MKVGGFGDTLSKIIYDKLIKVKWIEKGETHTEDVERGDFEVAALTMRDRKNSLIQQTPRKQYYVPPFFFFAACRPNCAGSLRVSDKYLLSSTLFMSRYSEKPNSISSAIEFL